MPDTEPVGAREQVKAIRVGLRKRALQQRTSRRTRARECVCPECYLDDDYGLLRELFALLIPGGRHRQLRSSHIAGSSTGDPYG